MTFSGWKGRSHVLNSIYLKFPSVLSLLAEIFNYLKEHHWHHVVLKTKCFWSIRQSKKNLIFFKWECQDVVFYISGKLTPLNGKVFLPMQWLFLFEFMLLVSQLSRTLNLYVLSMILSNM